MEEIHRRIPHRPPFLSLTKSSIFRRKGRSFSHSPTKPFLQRTLSEPIMPGSFFGNRSFKRSRLSCRLVGQETLVDETATPVLSRQGCPFQKNGLRRQGRHIRLTETDGNFQHDRPNQKRRQSCLTISFALALIQDEKNRANELSRAG